MAGFSINKQGRSYIRGKGVDDSLRCVIIDSIIAEVGDPGSGYFEGEFKEVAERYRVTGQFVSKLWKTFCETGDHSSAEKKSGNLCHLKPEDVEMIYFLKKEKPSKTYRSIKEDLATYCTLGGGTFVAAIGNIVRNKIPEAPFTRKQWQNPLQKNSLHRALFIVNILLTL